jgi:DNA-binding NarL/FixJ family response regulator
VIRVVLADDQALLRAGLAALLDAEDDIDVCAEAADGAQAIELVRAHRPDVVLMDIRMPGTDGLAATRAILTDPELGAVRVVMLTTFDLDEYVFEAVCAGASGFLVKNTEPEDLIRAVRVAASGDALLSPGVTRRLMERFGKLSAADSTRPGDTARAYPGAAQLTEREREIVRLVALGLSNGEIADRLSLSPLTAKTHVSRAMTKLACRDRAGLVVFAYQTGLITVTPGPSAG